MTERKTGTEFNELWDKLPSLKSKPSNDQQLAVRLLSLIITSL